MLSVLIVVAETILVLPWVNVIRAKNSRAQASISNSGGYVLHVGFQTPIFLSNRQTTISIVDQEF